MFEILEKRMLNTNVKLMKINAPLIAKKAKAGQFIMLRVDEHGERIPLTIADHDADEGTITIIFQEVGKSTRMLGMLEESDKILDFAGPLGVPTHYPDNLKRAAVIGGGLGTAIAYPQALALNKMGVEVDVITGFRNKDLIILEDEMNKIATKLYITTDDGSNGSKGFVTDVLEKLINEEAALLPLGGAQEETGGHKGYDLSTIVEILSSALQSGAYLSALSGLTADGKETRFKVGHFFMAMNIESFVPLEEFKHNIGGLLRELRASRRMPGKDRIYTAGEKEYAIEKEVRQNGIYVNENLKKDLLHVKEILDIAELSLE